MNLEQMEKRAAEMLEELQREHNCHGPVANCPRATLFIREPNTYQTYKYGDWKYVPVCTGSWRKGVARSGCELAPDSSKIISREYFEEASKEHKRHREQRYKDRNELLDLIAQKKKEDRYAFYTEHLQSDYWTDIRAKVLNRDRHVCQGCLSANATQVHHLNYKNLGQEFAFELVSMCEDCHKRLHHIEEDEARR